MKRFTLEQLLHVMSWTQRLEIITEYDPDILLYFGIGAHWKNSPYRGLYDELLDEYVADIRTEDDVIVVTLSVDDEEY
jgi:hypothetical protein